MAVIEKIRSRAGLLLGIIGFSLVAFILGDFLSSSKGIFSSNSTNVGVIGGKKINVLDFEAKVQEMANNYKTQNKTETIDQATMDQIREQAWNQLINDEVMGSQYKKIGLNVSSDELFDMVQGKNIHPQIRQAFTDPKTGQFSPANVISFLKNMPNDPTGKTQDQWLVFEKAIQQERIQQKYNDLVKQGLYVTKAEAQNDFIAKNRMASVRYVQLSYNSIVDSTIEVTDAELKAVYNENLKKYKQVASRSIDYVTFDVNPSDVDRQSAMNEITKLADGFRSASNDSSFVASNSDFPYDAKFNKKGTLPLNIDSVMFSAPVGTVVGPYEEGGMFKLAKLNSSMMMPDSVKASHILLKMDPAKRDEILARADSIKNAVKSGANFMILSFQYSTDDAAKQKGGDLGWFGPGMMVQQFNDACFAAKKGDVLTVETQFGIHIVQVNDIGAASRQVKVAYVIKKVEPSTKTTQMVYTKANEFANKNTNADAFDKAIKDNNLTKLTEQNITESARQVGPLENSRELVRWSFNGKVGDISKAFEFGNRFVIAKLTEIKEKGYSTLEQVKDQVTSEARRDKKAQILIEKFNKAPKGTLEATAAAVQQTVQTADNVNFGSPFLGAAGMEGNVIGRLMTMKAGQISTPLKGQSGVFVAVVNSFTEPTMPKDFKDAAAQLRNTVQSRAQYEVFNALKEKANIEDNRGKFY
jgi:peptidyl-prolyl cis-trans isomerase D